MKRLGKNIYQGVQVKNKVYNFALWRSMYADSIINTTAFLTGWYRELHESNILKIRKTDRMVLRRARTERNQLTLRRQVIIAEEARELLRRKYCLANNVINGQRMQNKCTSIIVMLQIMYIDIWVLKRVHKIRVT